MNIVSTLVLFLAYLNRVLSFDSRNVLFVIVSQPEPYHASVATRLKQDIEKQLELEGSLPTVHITHEDFRVESAWTIVPLFRPLIHMYKGSDVRWVVFVEPHTAIRCGKLIGALRAADSDNNVKWVGYPISDPERSIIHHYHFYEELEDEGGFVYPYFGCGFAMRMELINTLFTRSNSDDFHAEHEFTIDPAYELAQLVYKGEDKSGPLLTADVSFCIVSGDNCATYPRQFDICGSAIPEESIFFAVKTWSGFHDTRVKVVKKTWGRHVTNILFYSDTTDPSIPAVDTGVPNTKNGHCAKTIAILKDVTRRVQKMPHVKWIFLADDDTILGVQRLCEVLTCYRGGDDAYTVLGERYGYGYRRKQTATEGFDYVTLGSGAVFSVGAAQILSDCWCRRADHADDMTLGVCANLQGLSLTHSPLFHQNRPQDYPRELLARDRPVSFHRHYMHDPVKVYATWFQHDDLALRQRRPKEEL